jgi:hypothetical protein
VHREVVGPDLHQRLRELVDGVLLHRLRGVTAGVGDFEPEIGVHLLRRLDVVREVLAVAHAPAAPFVECVLCLDEGAVVLQQVVDAVVGPALLIGGERHDDVAVPTIPLGLEAHDRRQVHRAVVLVVGDAAPEEGRVLLDEGERRQRPVLGLGLDHVDVREEEQRLAAHVPSAQTGDEVPLAVVLLDDDHVGVGKTGRLEARRHRLRRLERAPRTLGRVDLDEFLEEVARRGIPLGLADVPNLLGVRQRRCREQERGGERAHRS